MTQMATEQITREQVAEPGDSEKMAHYVRASELADALVFGTAIEALCGKMWVPFRNPENFPVCPDCRDKWEAKLDE